MFAHRFAEFFGAFDEGFDDFARDEIFVSSDGGRQHKGTGYARAEQIIGIHDYRILGYAFPNGKIARFTPIKVSEAAFGTGAIGMHDVTIIGVIAQHIGYHFAESFWKQSFADLADGIVNVFFLGGDPALGIFVNHNAKVHRKNRDKKVLGL